ncbi:MULTISPECIES: LysR family transcriptional regulator [Bacillus amyloliquefaciens group]|uniref:LysR family transcriptional regulator n=1 Tax=Bacillus amyloliquefaciens group TaxID=1938374 RepID=UPI0002059989|nr:LysR family transcriptional regulator [Bacillus amyloliquefaciens]AIW33854.1 LysR family transcriptional regulator [Bacillus subtilis]AEB23721.1 YofA [Bacillus amyloliquefaciens TA208]AEK88715.1 putative transcriptional regulator [Bacillus amyloliquefaciens XH7]MEC1832564.1 LysR family transcriptional regulator [Bacillus amyloliquefaciens]MEC1837099.1 LysR family transcriptional regulator [Bacillus amyloliquefaciens]
MESGDLKVFQAVARKGSISKAAESLHYVQSNVTNRIQQLERHLQTQLFYRTNRGMTLTPAGENLLKDADRILHLLHEAQKTAQEAGNPNGPLRIGSLETAAAVHLPQFFTEYCKRYPKVQLSLSTGDTHTLVQRVLHYELDGAFVYGPVEHEDLKQIAVFQEELALVSNTREGSLPDLLREPILFFAAGCSHRRKIKNILKEEAVPVHKIIEFGTLETIISAVQAGMGVSFLPASSVRYFQTRENLFLHQLPEHFREMNISFIYRCDLFLTSAFEELLNGLKALQNGR